MLSLAFVLSGVALIFASYAALKEPTFAAKSCFVTALILFVLTVIGSVGR